MPHDKMERSIGHPSQSEKLLDPRLTKGKNRNSGPLTCKGKGDD